MNATHLVCGGAGFVAQTLNARLLADGGRVIAVDNLSRGKKAYLDGFAASNRFEFYDLDCTNKEALEALAEASGTVGGIGHIWHLAANSDIPAGIADASIDLKDTFLTTFHLAELAKRFAIPELHFASSSAVYGDQGERAIHEDLGPLLPISNYGAMKLASEAQLRAAVEAFLPRADIFRFPNVIGVPATHGVIFDFVRKLKATPTSLTVLGNGAQQKPYLHVDDLVDAMLFIASEARSRYNVFNIGPLDAGVTVRFIAETVRDAVSPGAKIVYGSQDRGWIGDVPRFNYDTRRLAGLGWTPKLSSEAAVVKAVAEIAAQEFAQKAFRLHRE